MRSADRPLSLVVILTALFIVLAPSKGLTQVSDTLTLRGQVFESGTDMPLKQVTISVSSTGVTSESGEEGKFEITVENLFEEIVMKLPGYTERAYQLTGINDVTVFLVQSGFRSSDDNIVLPLKTLSARELVDPVSSIEGYEINQFPANSSEDLLQGMIPGLHVIRNSGFPGDKAWLSIGGISSIYAKSEPLLIIDGMIHEYNYADQSVIDGFSFNPWDIIDVEDIANIAVVKGGLASWGSNGSNGMIYINTEQKSETSSQVAFSAYGGVGLMPSKLSLLNASQFREFYGGQLISSGQDPAVIPWLSGDTSDEEYYRYNNNTDWQEELFRLSPIQKIHFFLKGGDEIATYNISTGYLKHGSVYENSGYSRYNLRVNGNINISDKFSVVPNVKLSLSDTYLASMGVEDYKNPLTSALLKPSIMAPLARDPETGVVLNELDDVGVFNVSNPVAIVREGIGSNRNYHFLSSIDFRYKISDRLQISSLTGLSYNNSRESIFIPDHGLVDQEFADNSRHDLVYDFRSTQNHTHLSFKDEIREGLFDAVLGIRYMKNSYKYNEGNDLNTASDDFRNLGQGAKYQYLRTTLGDDRELIWASVYGVVNYAFKDKYFFVAKASYDGNSNVNSSKRYNFYPYLGLAWRLSSEPTFSFFRAIGDLKIRASYGISGNMHSYAYDYSKLFYVGRRLGQTGVVVRDAVPNSGLEIERKAAANLGLDFSPLNLQSSLHIDYYYATVNNLMINQQLPTFGFENYFDNGGKMNISSVELSYDGRVHFNELVLRYGFSANRYVSRVEDLIFLDDSKEAIVHNVKEINDLSVQYVTREDQGLNLFYGYYTEGEVYQTQSAAELVTGPGGIPMKEGDVIFRDVNGDKVIDYEDKMVIGDPNPDLYGGISISLIYKQIELKTLFTYSYGNDVVNYLRYKTETMDQYYNQAAAVADRWGASESRDILPRASVGDPTGNTVFSSRWIEDGSYLRLKNLTLSYTLPAISGFYRDLDVYITASNLLTFSNYKGYDPEFMYSSSPFRMGIDYGKIPQVRSILVGLKLSL